MAVKVVGRRRFGSLLLFAVSVIRTAQTVGSKYTHYFGVIPSGAVPVPLHIAVEVSGDDSGRVAEPATIFHEASVNLSDVVVRTFRPDRASPDRKQVEIHFCAKNPNGNHPFAEEFAYRLNRELCDAKNCQPLVWIGTEPQAGEPEAVENI